MESDNSYAQLVTVGLINQGGFGKIYKAVDPESRKAYALKVQEKDNANHLELSIHFRADPHFIAQAYLAGNDAKNFYILEDEFAGDLTLMPCGNEYLASYMTHQMGRGLSYLHGLGIVHRDIKPQNFLLTHDYQIRITDFGLSIKEGQGYGYLAGTLAYMSEEALLGRANQHSDWFAFGLAVFYLVKGEVFSDPSTPETALRFVTSARRFQSRLASLGSHNMKPFIKRFLTRDQESRSSYQQTLESLTGALKETANLSHDRFLSTCNLKPLQCNRIKKTPPVKMLDTEFVNDGFKRSSETHAALYRDRKKGRFVKEDTFKKYHPVPKSTPLGQFKRLRDSEGYNLRGNKLY